MAEIFEVSQINEYLRQRFEADEFLGSLLIRGELSFKPILPGDFRSVWSVGDAWGNVQLGKENRLEIIDGGLRLKKLGLPVGGVKSVVVDGNPVGFRTGNGFIVFDSEIAAKSSIVIK